MADLSDAALLLRRIPYGDTSLVCHFLTVKHGRVTLMARGARRAKSPFRATLAPLYDLNISWKSGRSGMGTLLDVERHEALLPEDRALGGLEILALASRLYQEGDPEGYLQTREALCLMHERHESEGMRAAVWSLLLAAGWIGDLSHCWRCGEAAEDHADMLWHQGELCCQQCGTGEAVSPGLRKSIVGVMQQAHVRLVSHDSDRWQHMIELVLRKHDVRFTNLFQSTFQAR